MFDVWKHAAQPYIFEFENMPHNPICLTFAKMSSGKHAAQPYMFDGWKHAAQPYMLDVCKN